MDVLREVLFKSKTAFFTFFCMFWRRQKQLTKLFFQVKIAQFVIHLVSFK